MTTLTLEVRRWQEGAASYRLLDGAGKLVWATRCEDVAKGRIAALGRVDHYAACYAVAIDDSAVRAALIAKLKELRQSVNVLHGGDVRALTTGQVNAMSLAQLQAAVDQADADLEAEQSAVAAEAYGSNVVKRSGKRAG